MTAVTKSKDKVWFLGGKLDLFQYRKIAVSSRSEVLNVSFDFHRKKELDLNINKTVSLLLPAWSHVVKIMLSLK